MNRCCRIFQKFASLNTQYLLNKSKNAVRFEAQNIIWDYEEVNYQAAAFSKGLASLSFQKDDTFLLRVPQPQQAEAYIVKLGTAGINANLILSTATTIDEASNQIKNHTVKGIIFEPTLPLGNSLYIDVLNQLIPELSKVPNGAKLRSKQYPNLLNLIQTNFYSYPGVHKFRSILNYADDKYFKIPQATNFQPIALPQTGNTLFVTQPAHEFAFRAGILNSIINGRFVVVVQPKQVNKVAQLYSQRVDLLLTEEIEELNPRIHVFVEQGSQILKSHPNRSEI